MDIIDVWLPILIILLSALSPLIKTFNNKNKQARKAEHPEEELFHSEMVSAPPTTRFQGHNTAFDSTGKEWEGEVQKKAAARRSISSTTDKPDQASVCAGLKNRSELKRAIILSEILNRKYD
ncbi:MAG: hypothetical protein RSE51_04150 [Bacteroidales bacterium]